MLDEGCQRRRRVGRHGPNVQQEGDLLALEILGAEVVGVDGSGLHCAGSGLERHLGKVRLVLVADWGRSPIDEQDADLPRYLEGEVPAVILGKIVAGEIHGPEDPPTGGKAGGKGLAHAAVGGERAEATSDAPAPQCAARRGDSVAAASEKLCTVNEKR